jgi:hypothetical protein
MAEAGARSHPGVPNELVVLFYPSVVQKLVLGQLIILSVTT